MMIVLKASETMENAQAFNTNDDEELPLLTRLPGMPDTTFSCGTLLQDTLHQYRVFNNLHFVEEDVGYWVKPRSTSWFSRFVLNEYDKHRWVEISRMTKTSVFALADLLHDQVQKQNTSYRLAINVVIRVAVTLFKLTQGANLTICFEMFAIGHSTVSKVLREVVYAINEALRHEIVWPRGQRLRDCQNKFAELCGLPSLVGAIDGTHVSVSKPARGTVDYFYFKSGGYTVNCQAVVDSEKKFLDLNVGMPGSTTDSRVLRRSSLYHLAQEGTILEAEMQVDGFCPYLVGNLGYPILPWLMVHHKNNRPLSMSETLFNKKLRKARCVVENAFGIFKQTFRELLDKTDLHITFVPDVVVCCALLHNLLLRQSHEDVEELLLVLRREGLEGAVHDDDAIQQEAPELNRDDNHSHECAHKRQDLGVYMTLRRRL